MPIPKDSCKEGLLHLAIGKTYQRDLLHATSVNGLIWSSGRLKSREHS